MAWVILFIAGLFEMAWALLLKESHGLTRLLPTVGFVVFMILSMVFLAQALKSLPLGTAYAVWTGIGAAGTAIVGMIWLGESREPLRILSPALLIAGIIGLQLTGNH